MKSDTEIERVLSWYQYSPGELTRRESGPAPPGMKPVSEVVSGVRVQGITGGSRSSDDDWWELAARYLSRGGGVWLEWPGEGKDPEWVDVIAPVGGIDRTPPLHDSTKNLSALVRVRLERSGTEVVKTGFEVHDRSGELTTRLLRTTPNGLAELIDEILEDPFMERVLGPGWRRHVKRPGRAGRPDVFYAEWASRYVVAIDDEPKAPIKRLVEDEETAGRYATESQIRAYLTKARSRGLLTRSEPGRAGGELTEKAEKALRRAGIIKDSES